MVVKTETSHKANEVDVRVSALVRGLRERLSQVENMAEFSRANDIDRRALNRYVHEGTEPTLSSLIKLAGALDVSIDELAFGRPRPERDNIVPHTGEQLDPDFVLVRRLAVEASAGTGRAVVPGDLEREPQFAFRHQWLRALGVAPHNAELLEAKGDSMSPTIQDGDLMLVNRGYGTIVNGDIYVLVVDGLVIVKRIHLLAFGGLMLMSDNPRYPSETIGRAEVNDLNIEARVVWYARAL